MSRSSKTLKSLFEPYITFEPEFVEISGWLQNENTCQNYQNRFCVTCMFSKFVNFVPIDLKIGAHIDWTYNMYLAKNALIKIT